MKTLRVLSVVLILVMVLMMAGCAPSEAQIQEAIAKTLTAAPTMTPTLTATPTQTPTVVPTLTPTATRTSTVTPLPKIAGIDTPIGVSGGVTLQFFSAELFPGEVMIGSIKMTPNAGRSVLVLKGRYTGNYVSFTNLLLANKGTFYVTDKLRDKNYAWVASKYTSSNLEFAFGFFVMTGNEPYTLRYDLGTPWVIELAPLFGKSGGTLSYLP